MLAHLTSTVGRSRPDIEEKTSMNCLLTVTEINEKTSSASSLAPTVGIVGIGHCFWAQPSRDIVDVAVVA